LDNAKTPNQIAAVIKHIVLSKEFAASTGAKPKSPLALVASFARVTGLDLTPTMPLAQQLAQCGQRLFGWPPPDGRPAASDYYLTPEYMRERWVLVARLAGNAWNNGQPKVPFARSAGQVPRVGDLIERWLPRFSGSPASVRPFLAALDMDPGQPVTDEKRVAQLVGLCAAAPQFQLT
jgi:hypothetical protein